MSVFVRLLLLSAILIAIPAILWAAEPRHAPTAKERARTLILLNQPVVMLQATFGQTTPEERVNRIVSTLRDLSEEDLRHPVEMQNLTRYQQPAVLFLINSQPFMLLSQNDLDEGDDLTLTQAAARVQQRLEQLRAALTEQYSGRYLLFATLKALLGLTLLTLLCFGLQRVRRAIKRYCQARESRRDASARGQLRRLVGSIRVHLATLCSLFLAVAAAWL